MLLALLLFALNLIGGLAVLKWGEINERAIIGVMAVYIFAVPLLEPFEIESIRIGVFGAEVILFACLFVATGRVARWWLIMAAGAQLIAVISHLVPLFVTDLYIWTSVSVRRFAGCVISLSLLLGAWETWARRVVALGGAPNGKTVKI